jgi:hypothetical protein
MIGQLLGQDGRHALPVSCRLCKETCAEAPRRGLQTLHYTAHREYHTCNKALIMHSLDIVDDVIVERRVALARPVLAASLL